MPARIKKAELERLILLRKVGLHVLAPYYSKLLHDHGCSIETHAITMEGWIVERMK